MDKRKDKIISILKEFRRKISSRFPINKMFLFGSQAKGTTKKDSDIDLIIVSKNFENKKSFRRAPELYHIWEYPYNVDIICLTPEEFELKKKYIGIIKEASKEAIEIK